MKVKLGYNKLFINTIEENLLECVSYSKEDADAYRYFVSTFKPYIQQGVVEINSVDEYFRVVRMISKCTDGEYQIYSDGSIYIG